MSKEKAIAKINNEIENEKNAYVKTIGEFLKGYLNTDPEAANKILHEDKTIMKSINAMKEEARKNKVDGVGVLSDEEGFKVVLKYYEIDPINTREKEKESFDVKLDDFL